MRGNCHHHRQGQAQIHTWETPSPDFLDPCISARLPGVRLCLYRQLQTHAHHGMNGWGDGGMDGQTATATLPVTVRPSFYGHQDTLPWTHQALPTRELRQPDSHPLFYAEKLSTRSLPSFTKNSGFLLPGSCCAPPAVTPEDPVGADPHLQHTPPHRLG